MNQFMIWTYITLQAMPGKVADRLRQDTGQTAAEYMGIIVIVGVILAAIAGSGIGGQISSGITRAITSVFSGAGRG